MKRDFVMNKNIIRILLLSDVMTLFFMNIIKNGMTIHFYKNIINIFKEINFNNFILFSDKYRIKFYLYVVVGYRKKYRYKKL